MPRNNAFAGGASTQRVRDLDLEARMLHQSQSPGPMTQSAARGEDVHVKPWITQKTSPEQQQSAQRRITNLTPSLARPGVPLGIDTSVGRARPVDSELAQEYVSQNIPMLKRKR